MYEVRMYEVRMYDAQMNRYSDDLLSYFFWHGYFLERGLIDE